MELERRWCWKKGEESSGKNNHLRLGAQTLLNTDSYSQYECLVKPGTPHEKRLMIDFMARRQSYECREITEIRWSNGEDNPTDEVYAKPHTSTFYRQ